MAIEKDLATPEPQPDKTKARLTITKIDTTIKLLKGALTKGYYNGEVWVGVDSIPVSIGGEDFDAIVTAEGEEGVAAWETIEEAIWAWLIERDKVQTA